ncbi:MAG: RIP metalloprotease RseP [Gammaproteobacteria bacterium TMED78]|nr:MAG: RIP metalloprotease RseP [Gammaproteobacteria bacterium TMED78]|tara:strand:- start:115122 stop:116495 length:1374 start_codon:yes stop_codon:yes gene_type:complete
MLQILISLISFFIAISILVFIHEYGHYIVAKKLGFKVLRFSIGFGKPIFSFIGKNPDCTEYVLSPIPLGGYVKLLDEREVNVDESELPRAFNRKPVFQRICVLLAGPLFNFVFAVLAYFLIFSFGVPHLKPTIGFVEFDSIAYRSGMVIDEEIVNVGNTPTPTLESATLAILDEILSDGVIQITTLNKFGAFRNIVLDVRGLEKALTLPGALFNGLGFIPGPVRPAILGEVIDNLPASNAGLQEYDKVLFIDEERINSFSDIVYNVQSRPNELVEVVVERNGENLVSSIEIGYSSNNGTPVGIIGVRENTDIVSDILSRSIVIESYNFFESLSKSIFKTFQMSLMTLKMIGKMIMGDVSASNISGPINIAVYAGDSAQGGLLSFINFLALISISLGVLNLLPIPMLDGGQIVYQLVEAIKGSPISDKALILSQQFGFFLIAIIISFAFYNDFVKLLS